jgi:hypothetical protein
VDLEALEQAIRTAALAAGATILEQLLAPVGVGRQEIPVRCTCGAQMQSCGACEKRVLTMLGWITFKRSVYVCPPCGKTHCPGDEELDIVHTSRSPGVRRQTSRLAAKETFQEVAVDLEQLAGIALCRKEAERIAEQEGQRMEAWMAKERRELRSQNPPVPDLLHPVETLYIELDGTGIPMVKREVEDRKGKQSDGTAKTREAKVGCVFTQTQVNEEGKPVRDPVSTTYVGAIESANQFGGRLYAEAVRRGLYQAKRVVVLGDGAEWVKNIAQTHFGYAQFIIDYYHASEHIGDLCCALFDRNPNHIVTYREQWTDYLWEGNIEAIIEQAAQFLPKNPEIKKEARTQINYFAKNKDYMQYGKYREQNLFIGSGVVEAACKHLVGSRLKQSGMAWTVAGANAILALRCVVLSNRMEEYWEQRAAA